MSKRELKPCPFCGEKPNIGSLSNDKQNWCIWCDCNRALVETGINGETLDEIIAAWNDRKELKAVGK